MYIHVCVRMFSLILIQWLANNRPNLWSIVKLRENWQGEKFDDKIIDGQKSDFYVDFNLKYNNKEVYNINRIAHTAK